MAEISEPPRECIESKKTNATSNHLLIAVENTVYHLKISENSIEERGKIQFTNHVSCLAINTTSGGIGVIGLWIENSIRLLNLKTMKENDSKYLAAKKCH